MKPRHTILLLVVLLALSGLYYGLQSYHANRQEALQEAAKVFGFAPENVQRMTIDRIDGPPCTAERVAAGQWRMLEPEPTIPPFHLMWERVAAHLADLYNVHTVLEQPGELAPYGLEMPVLSLQAELKDGKSFSLNFGDLEPTQRHRYARLDKGALFLASADVFFELNRSLNDLRHRFLVNDREAPLLEMEFAWIYSGDGEGESEPQCAPGDETDEKPRKGEESVAIVVRREDPESPWRMTAPVEGPGNHEKLQALAEGIQFAVGSTFIDQPESMLDYGLQPPRARITVKDAGGAPQTLWLGALDESPDKQGLFIKREEENTVRVADPGLLALLPETPLAWRDLRLLTRRVSDINRLEFEKSEGERLVLEKNDEGKWRLTEPVMEQVNPVSVSGYLSFFKDLAGEDFAQSESVHAALEHPLARIRLHYEDGSSAEILAAACPEEKPGYIASQDTGGIVTLTEAAVRMLLADGEAFRSRELIRFNKNEATELVFTFEDTAYRIMRREGRWVLLEPETGTLHNQSDVEAFLSALTPLQSEGLEVPEPPEDLSPYGLDRPVLEATITLSQENRQAAEPPISLQIGAPQPDHPSLRYVKSSTRQGIHLIKQEVMDEIREALRGIR